MCGVRYGDAWHGRERIMKAGIFLLGLLLIFLGEVFFIFFGLLFAGIGFVLLTLESKDHEK